MLPLYKGSVPKVVKDDFWNTPFLLQRILFQRIFIFQIKMEIVIQKHAQVSSAESERNSHQPYSI